MLSLLNIFNNSVYSECVKNNATLIKEGKVDVPITARYSVNSILRSLSNIEKEQENEEKNQQQKKQQDYICQIQLLDRTTDEAISFYWNQGFKCCALNFANAKHCGGSYISGRKGTQEEELMRCSPALYTTLNRTYYPFDHNQEFLYTPNVQFLKKFDKQSACYLLNANYQTSPTASIISAAAPDLRQFFETFDSNKMLNLLRTILYAPLLIDKECKIDTIIVGAFGCGAFKNDPNVMAKLFQQVINEVKPYYKNIVFAIPDKNSINYKTFKSVIEN